MREGIEQKFGFEWSIYREIIQLHKEQFLSWIQPIPLSYFKGKRFLDAGCGIGRNSRWPLEAGASSAYAFDFDQRTVAVARKNLQEFPQCKVGFESLYDLAYENEFDVAFCIGVIHHLDHPKKAVENIVRSLKHGGLLILWVYAYEGNETYLRWFNPVRQVITSRIPIGMTRVIAKICTLFLKIYLQFPLKSKYLKLLKKRTFRHVEAMVFDQLFPSIANYWRRHEVENLVKDLPVHIEHISHTNQMSWTLVAEKRHT